MGLRISRLEQVCELLILRFPRPFWHYRYRKIPEFLFPTPTPHVIKFEFPPETPYGKV